MQGNSADGENYLRLTKYGFVRPKRIFSVVEIRCSLMKVEAILASTLSVRHGLSISRWSDEDLTTGLIGIHICVVLVIRCHYLIAYDK